MNSNLQAFLAVIRACEGTAGPNGYRTLFGGGLFNSYDEHPRVAVTASGYTSTAAGAYQILSRSWDDYRAKTGAGKSFSPEAQDAYAVWAIRDKRKALDDVLAGRFQVAITRCANEWASLPGSPYGQPVRTMAYCLTVYQKAGGFLRPVPDTIGVQKPETFTSPEQPKKVNTQPKESPVGATLLAGLIPSILSLFSGRAQAAISKATGASPEVVQKFTADLAQQIESVSGVAVTDTATAMKAASIVANDPAKVAELEQRATNFVLAEMGGGLRGAQEEYAAINRDYDDDPAWRIAAKFLFNPVHWVTGVFLFYVQQFIPPLADKVKALDGAAAMGLIVIVFGVIAVVGVRWLGSYAKQQQD